MCPISNKVSKPYQDCTTKSNEKVLVGVVDGTAVAGAVVTLVAAYLVKAQDCSFFA